MKKQNEVSSFKYNEVETNSIIISQQKSDLQSLYNSGSFNHYKDIDDLISEAILNSIQNRTPYNILISCTGTKGGNKKVKKIVKSVVKNIFEALYFCVYQSKKSFLSMEQREIDEIKMTFQPVEILIINQKTSEEYSEFLWR